MDIDSDLLAGHRPELEMLHTGAPTPTPQPDELLYSPRNATRHEAEIISRSLRKLSGASSSSSTPTSASSTITASMKAQKKRAATATKKPAKQPMTMASEEDSEMQDWAELLLDEQLQKGSPASKKAAMAMRKQASIDQRRKRNREAMQRARQRDKVRLRHDCCLRCVGGWLPLTHSCKLCCQDYMDGLRDSARDLEQKHNALLAQVNERIAQIAITGQLDERARGLQSKLQSARDQAEVLKRQNLHFLEEIGDRIKREDRMEGLLRELMVRPRAWRDEMDRWWR